MSWQKYNKGVGEGVESCDQKYVRPNAALIVVTHKHTYAHTHTHMKKCAIAYLQFIPLNHVAFRLLY